MRKANSIGQMRGRMDDRLLVWLRLEVEGRKTREINGADYDFDWQTWGRRVVFLVSFGHWVTIPRATLGFIRAQMNIYFLLRELSGPHQDPDRCVGTRELQDSANGTLYKKLQDPGVTVLAGSEPSGGASPTTRRDFSNHAPFS